MTPPDSEKKPTKATYTGPVTVTLDYSRFNVVNESNLRLIYYVDQTPNLPQWIDVTLAQDIQAKTISGVVNSLGRFAIVEREVNLN